ncbi:MAG: MFS transporter [Candidatus Hydrogenedentota bacterium]
MTSNPTATRTFSPGKARVAIFMTLFTAGVGNSFVFAVLPALGRQIGLVEIQIGSIIAVAALVFMIAAPIWGHRSEAWGRRPVILFALGAYAITTILFATVVRFGLNGVLPIMATYILLLLTRSIFTAGISGLFPCSQAYMADITTPKERTSGMALVGMASGAGMIAGPGFAALFAPYGLITPFYAVAALAVIAGIFVFRGIVDVPREQPPEDAVQQSLFNRRLIPFFMLSTTMMTTLSSMQQSTGFYIQDMFHLSTEQAAQRVGGALMMSALASVSSQFIFVQRMGWSARTLLRTGPPITILGILLFATTSNYGVMVASMGVFGIGFGMIMPGVTSSLSMSVSGHEQGRVAGLNTSAQGMGFIIGPLLGSGLYQIYPRLPYALCVGLLCGSLFLVHHITRQLKEEGTHT